MQIAIVAYLRKALPSHYRVFAVPNGRFQASPRTIARLKAEGLTPGVWDMCIIRSDGWCAWIEVKSGAGKLSPAQVEFGDWLSAGGASTAVVRSVSEVEEVLREWGVPLKARVGA